MTSHAINSYLVLNQKGAAGVHRRPVKSKLHSTPSVPIDQLKSAARGQWMKLLVAAGLPEALLDGRGHACPRCGGRDRFAAFADVAERGAVHCRHCFTTGTDPFPGDGLATVQWLRKLSFQDACRWLSNQLETAPVAESDRQNPPVEMTGTRGGDTLVRADLGKLAEDYRSGMDSYLWGLLSDALQLPTNVLQRLQVGWLPDSRTVSWPMVDANGRVVGIRLRCIDSGRKWSEAGGREGLFAANDLPQEPPQLFISEGPTDTAALLSLGLPAIGRPSALGAVDLTGQIVCRIKPTECVVVADNDDAGRRGAATVAQHLLTRCRTVRIVMPPNDIGDAREWIEKGAKLEAIMTATAAAKTHQLQIKSEVSL